MKYLLLLVTALISVTSFAQNQFVNCETQKPISNLMIFDTDQNYIGITNEKGIIEKELFSQQIIINHPEYGNQTIDITKNRICIDFFNEELEELFIEKGLHVQKELLQALEISFKAFSDENSQKSIYKIIDQAFVNNVLNESLLGYLKISSNGKSIRYLEPHYKFTQYIHKKEYNYYINPQYSAFALDKQLFPLHNKKDYKLFVSMITESENSKSGNYYYIDLPKIDDFITIEVDPKSKKISRISFPKVQKDGRLKFKEGYMQYTNTEMFFDTQSTYKMTSLELKNYYEIEGKKVRYDFNAIEVNLPKKEVSTMKSYPLTGIGLNSLINVYMNQRRAYNFEKLGVEGTSPWYYK
nr:hypothetical protein [uncultured Flavobacterium sp.]